MNLGSPCDVWKPVPSTIQGVSDDAQQPTEGDSAPALAQRCGERDSWSAGGLCPNLRRKKKGASKKNPSPHLPLGLLSFSPTTKPIANAALLFPPHLHHRARDAAASPRQSIIRFPLLLLLSLIRAPSLLCDHSLTALAICPAAPVVLQSVYHRSDALTACGRRCSCSPGLPCPTPTTPSRWPLSRDPWDKPDTLTVAVSLQSPHRPRSRSSLTAGYDAGDSAPESQPRLSSAPRPARPRPARWLQRSRDAPCGAGSRAAVPAAGGEAGEQRLSLLVPLVIVALLAIRVPVVMVLLLELTPSNGGLPTHMAVCSPGRAKRAPATCTTT